MDEVARERQGGLVAGPRLSQLAGFNVKRVDRVERGDDRRVVELPGVVGGRGDREWRGCNRDSDRESLIALMGERARTIDEFAAEPGVTRTRAAGLLPSPS